MKKVDNSEVKIKHLNFATSSSVKLGQYAHIFNSLDIELYQAPQVSNLIEPQIEDDTPEGLNLLVAHPLRIAARFIVKHSLMPYMLEDTSLVIDDLSNPEATKIGLPGPYTKSWWNNLGLDGVLHILRDSDCRTAEFTAILGVYLGGSDYIFSRGTMKGTISNAIRVSKVCEDQVPATNPFHFHSIFIPEGADKTIAQMDENEFVKYDYRRKAAVDLCSKISEFEVEQNRQINFEYKK